ncbi:hypothetical protein [Streptomyces mirabilis]|uniref:hypothetical protein n=1 Tax=Streptomyces mirabilis TaxID=68239 RepID=UPI00339DD956
MPATDTPLISDPAGRDDALRAALPDLRLDRWLSTQELLAGTGDNWALRTSRSQILALYAAQSRAIDAWCREAPTDPDGLMMGARVLTQRLLNARAGGSVEPRVHRAVDAARQACWRAAQARPGDPVPWVCLLALAQFDTDRRVQHRGEHWAPPPSDMDGYLPEGPWPLLWEVRRRDPENREAYHRMLQYFHTRGDGALVFAQWVGSKAYEASVLLTLPLYAHVEDYRLKAAYQSIGYWSDATVRLYASRALHGWFRYADPAMCSLLDLNYLAYTLTACGVDGAGEVFEAIGPHATHVPWEAVSQRPSLWQDEFRSARDYALRQEAGGR